MGVTEGTRQPAPLSLLMTKLHPPLRREQTVARERLVQRLRAAPGIKLTVVAAPAGSGKTTLLGAWREVEEAERPVAWLTLDEGDNDSVVFWSYVLAALRSAVPTLELSTSPEQVGASRVVDRVLPELINELTAAGEVALVLDDFHRLSSGAARDSITWFVDHAPSTFRLVLATRSEPGLPLAALRAHAALLELRAADLAFTHAEAEDLLNNRLELGLEPDSVDGLVERTEGWPAGLYLAALSLQAVDDRRAFVARFGAENRHVVDFLVEEVLEAHDASTQALMLRASILDRLCGPVCDAVLEREGSGELLDALAESNLFLMPLDDRGHWYRFHHLFARLLRVELEHREPGLMPALHRRAFSWHRENGSVEEAIEHALSAAAFADAGDVIAAVWVTYAHVNRDATVAAWLERLPREVLDEDPRLLLVTAWLHSLRGRREEAAQAITAIERLGRLEDGPLPDGFSSVEASLAALRGLVAWGDVGSGLRNARRAAELEGPSSPWRPVVCFALGFHTYNSGELDEADRWLDELVEPARSHGQLSLVSLALAYRSLIAGDRGRGEDQALLADEAVRLEPEHGYEEVEGVAQLALGASLASRGRLAEALSAFEQSLAKLRSQEHPLPLVHGLLRYVALLEAMAHRDGAAEAIAEAKAVLDSCPDPGNLPQRLAALERRPPTGPRNGEGALSERELVILKMLGGSLSERDIGRELYLSHNTVHSHTRSIYRKLGVSSRSDALAQARQLGLF